MTDVPAQSSKTRVERIKPWIDLIQSLATITAILCAGYWFLLQRSTKQQVKLDQVITQRVAAGEDHTILVAIEVHATNVGKVKVELDPGRLDVTQINPRTAAPVTLETYELHRLTLEPGESDQAIFQVVPLYDTVRTIQVRSCYQVPDSNHSPSQCGISPVNSKTDDPHKYWNLLSVADLGSDANRKESATSVH